MLTPALIHEARHRGNKEFTNRKGHASRVRTALINLRNDCAADRGELKGLLNEAEIAALTEACHIVDKIAATLEKDAAEAKRIKEAWDKRVAALVAALREVTSESAADVVALMSLDRAYGLQHLADDCRRRWGGAREQLRDARRDAISGLAKRAAAGDAPPVAWAASIKAELPAHAQKHAALIAEINTIAVQQRLEQANRKEPVHA